VTDTNNAAMYDFATCQVKGKIRRAGCVMLSGTTHNQLRGYAMRRTHDDETRCNLVWKIPLYKGRTTYYTGKLL
jgi:hypothetical protein